MLYGHIETLEERVDHLLALRQLKTRRADSRHSSLRFSPGPYCVRDLPETTGYDDLKTLPCRG